MPRPTHRALPFVVPLALAGALLTSCEHRLSPTAAQRLEAPGRARESADGTGAASTQAIVDGPGATAAARARVRVLAQGAPVAGARVASRDARGAPLDVGDTGADGVVRVRVVEGGFVVAAAAGFSSGARRGAGDLVLVPLDAPEQIVTRLRAGRAVTEVVRAGPRDDLGLPRAAGLAPAPASTSPPATRFQDTAGHSAAAHIDAIASRGLVAGDPDGRFRPDDALTRAELSALVLRAAGIADRQPGGNDARTAFVDVAADDWFAPTVATARALGVVAGDPDGRFRPRDRVTRAELAAMLARVGNLPAKGNLQAVDVAATHWARGALAGAQAWCRLLDVDARGALRPDDHATRGEAAVALSRLLSCTADRGLAPGALLARDAADFARATFERHHRLLGTTGFGTHYGDESPFHRLTLDEKRAYVAQRARPGSAPLDPLQMVRSSCVEYAMSLAEAGHEAIGRDAAWRTVDERTRTDALRGTSLATHLVAAGWRAIYVNPDTTYRGATKPDDEHSYSLSVARGQQTYYDVPLSGAFLDWERDDAKKQAMDALPFGVLVVRGGFHVVAVADGLVHELARSEGPDSHVLYDDVWSGIIDVYANDVYGGGAEGAQKARAMWGSGVLLVPDGVELAGVTGL